MKMDGSCDRIKYDVTESILFEWSLILCHFVREFQVNILFFNLLKS